ncbi:MAG: hypothetical protein Q9191_005374, partial [Dirinaria sp. TL-2023a]
MTLLPPNPCLQGILLITKFDSDPKIVFHYPPRPGEDTTGFKKYFDPLQSDAAASSSDEDSSSSSEDEQKPPLLSPKDEDGQKAQDFDVEETGSVSPEKPDGMRSIKRQMRWDDIFGYNSALLAKLLCPAAAGRKKRLELALDDNIFLGRPVYSNASGSWRRQSRKRKLTKGSAAIEQQSENDRMISTHVAEDLGKPSGTDTERDDNADACTFFSAPAGEPNIGDNLQAGQGIPEHSETKAKDHLSMFHVVLILNPPPLEYHIRVKELYDNVVKKLSKAMKWEQVRSNYVAQESKNISSTTKRYFKAQKLSAPQLPGLWLTTATSIPIDDAHIDSSQLASHFGLLLLSDLQAILAEVNSTLSPLTAPLVHYLRMSKPTKSFSQISQSSGISLPDIQFLASHLIYWRRARAIPPLHQRDTFIVSPNADMSKLASAASAFAKMYPALPSLPKIMAMLSSTPRPYSTLIPSKDHKEAYMDSLAWLLRGGWVTQLRTFAWIRIPPNIIKTVEGQIEREKLYQEAKPSTEEKDGSLDIPPTSSSPTSSTHSSTHTTFPIAASSPLPSPILVSQSRHPTTVSSKHLSAISAHILNAQGAETQSAWNECVKYFDGKHALETIAVREGWKRKRVAELITGWETL